MCIGFSSVLFALCIKATMYGNVVSDPFEHDVMQRGVNSYITAQDVNSTDTPVFAIQSMLDRLEAKGLNSVSLTWPVFTDNSRSNRVYIGETSLTPEMVNLIVEIAKARGFGVWLHPILDERSLMPEGPRVWRGSINPRNTAEWFDAYEDVMTQYARAGTSADGFIIGTELWSMEPYHEQWQDVVQSIEVHFDGELSYASNRGIADSDFDWTIVDIAGINYFPSLNLPSDALVDQITEAIQHDVDRIVADAQQQNIPIMLSEVGTTSQTGSITHTGRWGHKTTVDLGIQSRYYQAICQAWSQHVDGVYWWNTTLFSIADENLLMDGGFDPIGKDAAEFMDCTDKMGDDHEY